MLFSSKIFMIASSVVRPTPTPTATSAPEPTATPAPTPTETPAADCWQQVGSNIVGSVEGSWTGSSVSLSGNGNVLAVGAPTDGVTNLTGEGEVKVYALDVNGWTQRGLTILGANVGLMAALNYAGDIVAVSGGDYETGATYVRVFSWNGAAWTQLGPDILDETLGDQSIAISLDHSGTVLAVGARYASSSAPNAGNVRVFDWGGATWAQRGATIGGEAVNDFFGCSVSLNGNGSILAAGAESPLSFGGQGGGYANVHEWSGTAWVKRGSNILAEANDDNSGVSVSLSNDGGTLAVGAVFNASGGPEAGHVRVHAWNGSSWSQKGADIDGFAGDWNGYSVSLSGDGNIVAIGSPMNGAANGAGKVATYSWTDGSWSLIDQPIVGGAPLGQMGRSVSLSDDGTLLAVGSPSASQTGLSSVYGRVPCGSLSPTPTATGTP